MGAFYHAEKALKSFSAGALHRTTLEAYDTPQTPSRLGRRSPFPFPSAFLGAFGLAAKL